MDPKTWRWRKRSSEKAIVANEKTGGDSSSNRVELGSETSSRSLNEKLSSVLVESQEKDELIAKQAKAAEEAIADYKRAEARAELLKLELDDALIRAEAANERSASLETELKECSEKLNCLIEDSEKIKKSLEEKASEMEKRIDFLSTEIARLSSELLGKNELIEGLQKSKSDVESEFNALMARLDSVEKENAFLKYELCVMEKEVSIRNEELEYNRQAADVAQQKHLECTRTITKLEGECHRLRVLLQRRLPGPADVARMKTEVSALGLNHSSDPRRRRSKPLEASKNGTKLGLMMDRFGEVEEENKALKELIALKEAELVSSKTLSSETSTRLSELEARVSELSRGHGMELAIREPLVNEASNSPMKSSSGSWANALITELEHFRNEKLRKNTPAVDNLAIVPVSTSRERGEITEISFDWLQVVLNAMTEQTRVSNRSLMELFEDVKIALGFMDRHIPSSNPESPEIKGYLTWKCDWIESVRKIVELIEGFGPPTSAKNSDYFVHVFQLKNTEMIAVKEKFIAACKKISDEKSDLEVFVQELASALDWIMNSDSTPRKNASNVRDRIMRKISNSDLSGEEENSISELKVIAAKDDVEERLREAEECIGALRSELKKIKESKGEIEGRVENLKTVNEDLDTQLNVAKSKLGEVFRKFSSVEAELEEKNNCCEELESTCLELQLQLESVAKETPKHQKLTLSRTGWEIGAATMKLAECQETILNLGRQLKALSSPREAAFVERATCKSLNNIKRSSLRDRMIAEDGDSNPKEDSKSPGNRTVDVVPNTGLRTPESGPKKHGAGALIVVQSKKQSGIGFLRRLLMRRRRRGSSSKKAMSLY